MTLEEFEMPILYAYHERKWRKGLPNKVLLPASCEEQAQRNHGQSLQELKDRGGLDWTEVIWLMRSQKWGSTDALTVIEIVDACREYHWI